MAPDAAAWPSLVAGSVLLRPYVFIFLAAFLLLASRHLGPRRAVGWLAWGWGVAFAAEYFSTRVGVPFGLYHYTGKTVGRELFISNVPVFDSLSFPFLAYASYCLACWTLRRTGGPATAALAGALMMFLDVVVDPLAVRGERWFLGDLFYYAEPGIYFGVPLSNFAGWLLVGWAVVGGYLWIARDGSRPGGSPRGGIGLYYGVLLTNLVITGWIGERLLLAAGILLHLAVFLILYRTRAALTPRGSAEAPRGGNRAGPDHHRAKRGGFLTG